MGISPYVGGRASLDGQQNVIRLASNESALGPSPRAVTAYEALGDSLHRYPDGGAEDLRAALGALIFGVVQQGLFFAGVESSLFRVFLGVILLLAVILNTYIRRMITGEK